MANNKQLLKIHEILGSKVNVVAAEPCQPDLDMSKLVKDGVKSSLIKTTVSLPTSGASKIVLKIPDLVFCVVTSDKMIIIEGRTTSFSAEVGSSILLEKELSFFTLILKAGIYKKIILVDRASGQKIMDLNFGWRNSSYQSIINSARLGGAEIQ